MNAQNRALSKPLLVALAAYSLLVMGLFLPYVFGNDSLVVSLAGEDVDQQYFAWRAFGFAELASGRLPVWNPYIYGGAPYLAGFQSALFYPINWVHLLFDTARAINIEVATHVWLAGV